MKLLRLAPLLVAFALSPALHDAQDALFDAAAKGDAPALAAALAKGGDLNRRDLRGRTALMRAAEAGSFAGCRELLWAGADANASDKSARTALDHVGAATPENVPLRFLLRAYAYLQKEGHRATQRPATPQLVMILEDTVNYLHPRIEAAYKQNKLEALGADGKDDDRNGFVDDVWGWDPVADKPYTIPPLQLEAYLTHREAIGKILRIHNDEVEGKLSSEEAARLLDEYTNPLAGIMGPLPELSDRKFLDMLMNAAHGSHVAGIVLDASENSAKLHTLAMDFTESAKRMLGPNTDAILDQIHARSCDPDVVLEAVRTRLVTASAERARRMSRYLQASGAGIANMSFGGNLGIARSIVSAQVNRCQERRWNENPLAAMSEDVDALIERWVFEFYSAVAVEYALLFYENPDVLFAVAAGNEDVNNDSEYILPAYLSRFFPNVITVAATIGDGSICSFSNYGLESVDLGAPGANILSTVVPEAPVYMSGTSMATPYVAGVAARLRSLAPALTAAEVRRLLAYTSQEIEQLGHFVSSGGLVDRATLLGVVQGTPHERCHAQARIAIRAAGLSDERYPRHAADARAAAEKAMQLEANNGEAWLARAAVLFLLDRQPDKAFEAVQRSVQLDPGSEPAWMERAWIAAELGDADAVFVSLAKAIEILASRGESANLERARRLALSADLHLQLGMTSEAASDARLAREAFPELVLSAELEALL